MYPNPQSAQPASAAQTSGTAPTRPMASPWMIHEMTSESFRPYTSAITPVGTSKTKTAASITVPTRTSSSGFSSTVLIR